MERANLIRARERECQRLERRIRKEIQFNRKVELNGMLRERQADLLRLRSQ